MQSSVYLLCHYNLTLQVHPLFTVQLAELSDDTQTFNEFVDKYTEYTAENVAQYNQERIELLDSFHKRCV